VLVWLHTLAGDAVKRRAKSQTVTFEAPTECAGQNILWERDSSGLPVCWSHDCTMTFKLVALSPRGKLTSDSSPGCFQDAIPPRISG
jgi:hypothetical protein